MSLNSLSRIPHIPYNSSEEAVYKWYLYHHKRVPSFKWSFMVNTAEGVLQSILLDMGLGVIPRHMLSSETMKKIYVVPTKKRPMVNTLCLIQLASKVPNETEKAAERFLLNSFI